MTLEQLCSTERVTIESTFEGEVTRDSWRAYAYRCVLRFGRRRLTVPFFQGVGHTSDPTAAAVLGCLISDAQACEGQTFEGFCAELGFDSDSRKAEQTYRDCVRMGTRVRRLLGSRFEAFAGADQ